jgi:hypothetical protein
MNRLIRIAALAALTTLPALSAAELIGPVTLSAPVTEGQVETARGPVALKALLGAAPPSPPSSARRATP